ncbi:MAG: hypothetical protein K8R79_11095 [Calditrichales bacterium]|nr:hypothetical protein [Calditrichales bacterium]
MIDEIIDVFISRIKRDVITDDKMTVIPLAYLITRDIPDSIKHFFNQEVELWIRAEEEKFTSNESFDYDMPEVRMLIDQIFDHLKQNATFHVNKFNQLLERAVKLEMNYLIEPHRTLSQFLFKDSKVVSTMEIYDTLKYFFKYEYYKNAISDYFNLKYLREISQDQFIDLINQIDEKAFAENRLDTTLKIIKTAISSFEEARGEKLNNLSVDVLHTTLCDRNLDDYAELADRLRKETELSELTFEEIETMLREGKIPGIEEEEVEEVEEKAEVKTYDELEDIETSKPEVAVDEIEVQEMKPDTAQIEEEVEEVEEEEEEEEEEVEEEVAVEEPPVEKKGDVAQDLADYVAKQISSDTPLESLDNMIKGRTRKKIIKKLFKKKENEFIDFISSINQLSTWKEASSLIDEEFYSRDINPYSNEAINLSDTIYQHFFPKDKYVGENHSDHWQA